MFLEPSTSLKLHVCSKYHPNIRIVTLKLLWNATFYYLLERKRDIFG